MDALMHVFAAGAGILIGGAIAGVLYLALWGLFRGSWYLATGR